MSTTSVQKRPVQDEIMRIIREASEPMQPKQLAEVMERSKHSVQSALKSLKEKGKLAQPGYGLYDLPENVEEETDDKLEEQDAPKYSLQQRAGRARRVNIPLLSVRVNAGEGEDALEERVTEYMSFDRDQIERETGAPADRLVILPVTGSSMEPTLRPGDRVMVQRYDGGPLQDGAIYIFRSHHRGILVKRLWWEDSQTAILRSDNDEGPELTVQFDGNGHEWEVLGRVVRVEKNL